MKTDSNLLIDKNLYSLKELQGIEPLFKELIQIEFDYRNYIKREKNALSHKPNKWFTKYKLKEKNKENRIILDVIFRPTKANLRFHFTILGLIYYDGTFHHEHRYLLEKIPFSLLKINDSVLPTWSNLDDTKRSLINWAELIKGYSEVKLTELEIFAAESAQEYFEELNIKDAKASTTTFSNDQQISLFKYLEFLKYKVEQDRHDNTKSGEIISDIDELQRSISFLTKDRVIRFLSNILAKIKVFSLKVAADTFDVAKKEIIKKMLYGAWDELHSINYFDLWK